MISEVYRKHRMNERPEYPTIIHIAPIHNIRQTAQQGMQMILTHLVERYPEYRRAMQESPNYKILDNSLIELGDAVSMERIYEAAKVIGADEIILPDKFKDSIGTLQRVDEAISWLDKRGLLGEFKLMAVAQGRDYKEFEQSYRGLELNPHVDVIGVPKVCAKLHPAGRPYFEHLWLHSVQTVHLLGLWYSWTELFEYQDPSRIRSMDTLMAAYITNNNIENTGVRPDGFTLDLETTKLPQYEYKQRMDWCSKVFYQQEDIL